MPEPGLTTGSFDPADIDYHELSFSREEYADRQASLRAFMRRDGLDVVIVTNPDLVCYLHGFRVGWYKANAPVRYPQCYCTVVRADDERIIHFDDPTEAPVLATTSVCEDLRYFRTCEPAPNLAFVLDELAREGWIGAGPVRVGVEQWCYLPNRVIAGMLEDGLAERGAEVVDCSAMVRDLRRRKSPAEIAYIEEAVAIAEIGHRTVREVAKPGMTELELFGEVLRAMMAANGELAALIPIFTVVPVTDGRMAPFGHSLPGRRRLAPDTVLCADLCGVVHRYHGNQFRGHYIGDPPSALVEQYEKAAGVYPLFEREFRAGLTVGEVNARLMAYYAEVGLDTDEGWALGYELGLSLPPDWVGDFYFTMRDERFLDRVFEPGMVTNFESLFNTALIDTMVWEPERVRLLASAPPALSVVPV